MYQRSCTRCFHCEACASLIVDGAMFEMSAKGCPYYLVVTTPNDFAKMMRDLENLKDVETRHSAMDDHICDLLRQFGYGEAIDIFKKTQKWYG